MLANGEPVVAACFCQPNQRDLVLNEIEVAQEAFIGRRGCRTVSDLGPVRAVDPERFVALLVFERGEVLSEIPCGQERRPTTNRPNQLRRYDLNMWLGRWEQIKLFPIFGIHRKVLVLGKKMR